MKNLALAFWNDDHGVLISAELVIVGTVLVLGLFVGLTSLQSAVVFELTDIARAFCSLNQTFFFSGYRGCKSHTVGSSFTDFNNCARVCFIGPDFVVGGVSQGGVTFGVGGFGGVGGGGGFSGGGSAIYYDSPTTVTAPAQPCLENCPAGSVCPTDHCPNGVCPPGSAPMLAPGGATTPPATVPGK